MRNVAAGSVGGHLIQAGVVNGDVYIHDSDNSPIIPRQLLPPDEHFIGRQAELAQLDDAMEERSGSSPLVVLLRGPGGVGKTALALQWLGRLADRFPDGQMYADLADSNGEPVAPEDLLGQFLRALGLDPQRIPTGLTERAALFRSVTATRSVAMLLDNAVSAAQVRVLLPASGTSLVAVTSRRTLLGLLARGARVVQVGPLDPKSALDLLGNRVGADRVKAEPDEAETLAALCGGLPIALCVAAALTVSRPSRSLASMAEELVEEYRRLEVLSIDDDMSVRATFDLSYADLSEAVARTYRALGLCPGTRFSVELIAAATDTDLTGARRLTDQLVDASLLEESGDAHYRFHDLIRMHANERALSTDAPETRTTILRRMAEWYLQVTRAAARAVMPARTTLPYEAERAVRLTLPAEIERYDRALGWLELQRRDLVATVRAAAKAHWHDLVHQLAFAMQPLFIVHKHVRDAAEVDELAFRAAQDAGDPVAENEACKRLARALIKLGEFDKAAHHLDVMLDRNRATGNRRGEAHALKSQGFLFAETDQLELAVAAFQKTLDILEVLGQPRERGLVLINIGETLSALGRFGDAETNLKRAHAILSTLDISDCYNTARAAIHLGTVQVQTGSYGSARELLHTALATMTELNSPFEQARAHRTLAELARRTGDDRSAERHQEIAAALAATPGLDHVR